MFQKHLSIKNDVVKVKINFNHIKSCDSSAHLLLSVIFTMLCFLLFHIQQSILQHVSDVHFLQVSVNRLFSTNAFGIHSISVCAKSKKYLFFVIIVLLQTHFCDMPFCLKNEYEKSMYMLRNIYSIVTFLGILLFSEPHKKIRNSSIIKSLRF